MADQDDIGKLRFWREADGSGQLRMGDWGPPKPRLQDGLLFRRPADGSGKLVFGYTVNPGVVTTPDADLALVAGFADDMRARIGIALPVGLGIHATFANDMVCRIEAHYDSNVDRTCLGIVRQHAQPAQPVGSATRSAWQQSRALGAGQRQHAQPAQPTGATIRARWQDTQRLAGVVRQHAQPAQPVGTGTRARYQQTIALRASVLQRLQAALPIGLGTRARYQQVIVLRAGVRSRMQPGLPLGMFWRRRFANGLPLLLAYRQHMQPGRYPVNHHHPVVPEQPDRDLCYCPDTLGQLVFRAPYTGDGQLLFVCRPCPKDPGEPDPGTPGGRVVVPVRGVYVVINELDLARADDGTPILADALDMSLDADSWTWRWQASLPMSEQAKITPAGTDPVGILAHVNGQTFHLLAETYNSERQFGRGRIRVTGRGRAAMLDERYAAVRQYSADSPQTAQQLMMQALTINGVPIGWSLDWQITDWLVPANTWTASGAPIAAILDVAAAAGAMVQPHRTGPVLRILPRYVAAPWHWSDLTPDIELPSAAVQVEGMDLQAMPGADRIYVSGTTGNGVLVQATRAGKPGTEPLPMEIHPLVTDVAAARQLAVARLGWSGRILMVSLRLPVLPETGLIEPGQMVKYTDGPTEHLGVVRSVRLDWRRPTLRQTITLETHP